MNIRQRQKYKRLGKPCIKDVRDLDYQLGRNILPLLVRFKQMKRNGYPGEFYKEGQDEAIAINKWESILDAMIWSFNELVNSEPNYPIKHDFGNSYVDDKGYWHSGYEWTEEEHKVVKDYYNKKQHGFELFGKYYSSLWD